MVPLEGVAWVQSSILPDKPAWRFRRIFSPIQRAQDPLKNKFTHLTPPQILWQARFL